ncbi:uncharacterized protein [Pseudorca crassidens]|uniref:uncharacterized protein isoform X8 n=1 Tax=Pseudorca crassidens TaxID=82174 RepID=UPI00352E7B81
MRWNFEEQHGNEILLLYLVGGENVPACMPTGTTFSRTVKPSVNYAVPPSSRILVPGPHNEELGVPVASPAERKGETEMREKIKGTLGAIWCCCRPKSSNRSSSPSSWDQLKHGQGLRKRDFPGGTVVKNPPANAGYTGLSPGPERSHMPRSN